MDDYVPKPFNASHLISAIAKATGREIRRSGAKVSPGKSESAVSSRVTDLTYLDNFCEGDHQRMQKYIDLFLASAPGFINTIQVAASAGDLREIASQMHAYKTKFMMMGMKVAQELASEIELSCIQGNNTDSLQARLAKLAEAVETAVMELNLA